MHGRTRKLGLGAVVVGGTLLFGIGLAGAQSSSGGGVDTNTGGSSSRPAIVHTSPSDVMIGASSGSSGCAGDGGVTGAVVSEIDL
jgi:hypothetical protein